MLAVVAAPLGEFRNFHPESVSRGVWFALLYLIVAGSIVGFTAYIGSFIMSRRPRLALTLT